MGKLFVDRFAPKPIPMPTQYGYISQILSDDNYLLGGLLITAVHLVLRCVLRYRPLGVLNMENETACEQKILCQPHIKLDSRYEKITDLESPLIDKINYFKKTTAVPSKAVGSRWAGATPPRPGS